MTERRAGVAEVMKYVIFAVIIGYVVLLLMFTSGSSRSFDEVADSVRGALDTETLTEMNDQALKRNFGLNSADYDGVLYYAAESSMSAEEVLLIKVKSDDQVQEVTDALNERIETRLDAFEGYAPEEAKKLENANQSVRGEFIFFAVSSQAKDYRAAFDGSL